MEFGLIVPALVRKFPLYENGFASQVHVPGRGELSPS